MCTNVKRWGNSLAIRLPKAIATELDLQDDAEVNVTVEDGKIVISRTQRKYALDSLVAGITPENVHGEAEWGPAVGKEVW